MLLLKIKKKITKLKNMSVITNYIIQTLGDSNSWQRSANKLASGCGVTRFANVSENCIRMKLPKNKTCANRLYITYKPGLDLYDMKFVSYRKKHKSFEYIEKVKYEIENCYDNMLKEIFENKTGFYVNIY